MEPRYNEGPRDWKNLFVITRFRYFVVPDECGHLLATRNRAVVIKRCTTSEGLEPVYYILRFFFIYFAITGVKKFVRHAEDFFI